MSPKRRYIVPERDLPAEGFTMLPDWILRTGVSLKAAILWSRLARYAGKDGEAWPSQTTLGKFLGLSLSQVKVYLRELREAELLEWTTPAGSNEGRESCRYRFPFHPAMTGGVKADGVRKTDGPPVGIPTVPPSEIQPPPPSENRLGTDKGEQTSEETSEERALGERTQRVMDAYARSFFARFGRSPSNPDALRKPARSIAVALATEQEIDLTVAAFFDATDDAYLVDAKFPLAALAKQLDSFRPHPHGSAPPPPREDAVDAEAAELVRLWRAKTGRRDGDAGLALRLIAACGTAADAANELVPRYRQLEREFHADFNSTAIQILHRHGDDRDPLPRLARKPNPGPLRL
jgi:hypothetical protein